MASAWPQNSRSSAAGAVYARLIAFLLGFAGLLLFVCHYYLIPAMYAARTATPRDKRVLEAHSRLVLAIVLFILLVGLLLSFRIGRFFFPRPRIRAKPTDYPDAWAAAGQRMQLGENDQSI